MSAHEIRSITQVGTSEPFELQVARGQIPGHKTIFKFGFNPDIDDSLETIWAEGGLYSYLSAATILKEVNKVRISIPKQLKMVTSNPMLMSNLAIFSSPKKKLSLVLKAAKIPSIAPLAPNKCPVIDFVELIFSLYACSPKTFLTAVVSALSPNGVEVP